MYMRSKWNNYGLYISLASLVYLALEDVMPWNCEEYTIIINSIMMILTTLGILSNPTQGKFYLDK